jgi:hypothetical protein
MATYISDIERRLALVELLTHEDPVDRLRRHRIVLEGHPDRYKQVQHLASAYVQMKLHELRERESFRQPTNDAGVRHDGPTVAVGCHVIDDGHSDLDRNAAAPIMRIPLFDRSTS